MAESLDELEAEYRARLIERRALLTPYMRSSHRASMTDAEVNARALCLKAGALRADAGRNYNARCSQPGTWQTTIERARSEYFTRAFDEVAKMLDWCVVRDAEHGDDRREHLAKMRATVFDAWWTELIALNAWWTARDSQRMLNRLGPQGREQYLRNRYARR